MKARGLRWVGLCVLLASAAQAHLMVEQKGTLNLVPAGGFLVLSMPVAAFPAADLDGDGLLTQEELNAHRGAIEAEVKDKVQLRSAGQLLVLDGLLLNLSQAHDARGPASAQVVALGRFEPAQSDGALELTVALFGPTPQSQRESVTITRGQHTQLAVFTPGRARQPLFPSRWVVLRDFVVLGAEHIVTGFDHLLFLLVVLAAGGGWRRIALVLTCFTAGHAVTLALGLTGLVRLPAAVVEPAIAATIIGMVLYDWRARVNGTTQSPAARLGLVFGFALIHGLGLAASLESLGVARHQLLEVLAGFNLGVELAQLAVSLVVGLAGWALLRGRALPWARQAVSAGALVLAGVWLVERLAVGW